MRWFFLYLWYHNRCQQEQRHAWGHELRCTPQGSVSEGIGIPERFLFRI